MIGLIKKDLLFVKGISRLVLIFLLFLFIVIFAQDGFNFYYILPCIVFLVHFSTFSYDEFNNWDAYAISFPVKRKDIVKAKYLSGIIMMLLAFLVTVVILIGISIFKDMPIVDAIKSIVTTISIILVFESLMLPFVYKFGSEKGRIISIVGLFLVVALVGFILSKLNVFDNIGLMKFVMDFHYIIAPIGAIIIIVVSYFASRFIYERKEF